MHEFGHTHRFESFSGRPSEREVYELNTCRCGVKRWSERHALDLEAEREVLRTGITNALAMLQNTVSGPARRQTEILLTIALMPSDRRAYKDDRRGQLITLRDNHEQGRDSKKV